MGDPVPARETRPTPRPAAGSVMPLRHRGGVRIPAPMDRRQLDLLDRFHAYLRERAFQAPLPADQASER